ncbi:MAG: hypothetical protein IT364_26830 [Candidatus Hydrogenedentes bacterium]|nr:hypothetical protein [Candidatus Hydrogenedentota bacterium]
MTSRFMPVLLLTLLIACPAFPAAKPAEDAPLNVVDLPWNLRDHYTITTADGGMYITYGGDNGQWDLDINGVGNVLNKVGASFTLGDGTVVETTSLGTGDTTRNKNTASLGEGLKYQVTLKGPQGLEVVHSITYHKQHPFYVVQLELVNKGDKPLDIAKIAPIQIGPGGLRNLSAETTVSPRRFSVIGASPVIETAGPSLFELLNDPVKNITLAIGTLPVGKAASEVDLQQHEGKWQGGAVTSFEPLLTVAPGATLASDPAWIAFTIPKPADVDMFYAWAQANMPNAKSTDPVPDGWVTVADDEPLVMLQHAAAEWNETGVEHVLVPVTWEGRPGSLEGAVPDFPKEMRSVASGFRNDGLTPGITVDPLAVQGGDSEWTAVSEDGQRWVNPVQEKGMEFGVAQMKKVAEWGFAFYAVAPSRIPDEVLRHFNITRAQANALAFEMMMKAAGGAPVVGASRATLGTSIEDWLLAAAATSRLGEYSVVLGPVRFDASKAEAVSDELLTAMAFFGGPIELTGTPSAEVKDAIARIFPRPAMWPRALDAASPAPKLWQVHVHADKGVTESLAIVSFAGARAQTPEDSQSPSGKDLKTWSGDAAGFLASMRKPPVQ